VAHYNVEKPALPDVWTSWEFWQNGVTVGPGYPKAIDRDLYRGSEAELRAKYAGGEVVPPVVPPVTPPPAAYELAIITSDGGPYVVGNYPVPGTKLALTDPWGNSQHVKAGDKPEYGAGGFLFNAYVVTDYTLTADAYTWTVPVLAGKTTRLSWVNG